MTSDGIFLAAAMEHAAKVEQQAYLFHLEKQPGSNPVNLDSAENRLYVLRDEFGMFLGTGHIYRPSLNEKWGAVGMYTVPERRNEGIGRSIISFLTDKSPRRC